MYLRPILISLLLSLISYCSISAQADRSRSREETKRYYEYRLGLLRADELISDQDLERSLEIIDQWLSHPRDLNTITSEELAELPLLSSYQIYQFIRYRTDQGGRIASLYDLKGIEGWDEETARHFASLFAAPETSATSRPLGSASGQGHSRAWLYTQYIGAPKPEAYIGSGQSVSLGWQYRERGRLSAFLGAEQDAYEPWHYGRHRGFDSYAGHLAWQDRGLIRLLVVGDYRVHWGEGLTIGQGFALRPPYVLEGRPSRITPVSGLAESGKSRGVALELRRGALGLSALYSQRKLDGRLDEDGSIYALEETGLHRTPRDWERRGQIPLRHWGLSLAYRTDRLRVSGQIVGLDFRGYRLARPTGASSIEPLEGLASRTNLSLAYSWSSRSGRGSLSGEVARGLSRGSGMAWVQHLGYRSDRWGTWMLGARYISPTYWSYLGQSSTHYVRPNNEAGLSLVHTTRELLRHTELELGLDLYRSLAPRRTGTLTHGRVIRLLLTHSPSSALHLSLQLGHRVESNRADRLSLTARGRYTQGDWELEPSIGLSRVQTHWGRMAALRLRYTTPRLQLWVSGAGFAIGLWEGRLYYPSPRLRHEHTWLMLSGRGAHISVGGRLRLSKSWSIEAKIAHLAKRSGQQTQTKIACGLVWH